jgi:hypothetical protein
MRGGGSSLRRRREHVCPLTGGGVGLHLLDRHRLRARRGKLGVELGVEVRGGVLVGERIHRGVVVIRAGEVELVLRALLAVGAPIVADLGEVGAEDAGQLLGGGLFQSRSVLPRLHLPITVRPGGGLADELGVVFGLVEVSAIVRHMAPTS